MILTFPYLPNPVKDPTTNKIIGAIYRPLIPIRIQFGHRIFPYQINSLLDSGADNNLFPSFFADKIGIGLKKGKPRKITGIGDIEIIAYRHPVKIFLDSKPLDTFIDFSLHQTIPILGRIDFFKFFEGITFKERERVVKIRL